MKPQMEFINQEGEHKMPQSVPSKKSPSTQTAKIPQVRPNTYGTKREIWQTSNILSYLSNTVYRYFIGCPTT